jgi:RNA methyltransferase, TrmH family
MISKNEVKYIQTLYQKKQRQLLQRFVVEGVKPVAELLQSNWPIEIIYATHEWPEQHPLVQRVTLAELERLSNLQSPQQVLAVVQFQLVNPLPVLNQGLWLALDGIQDPGNLGTIIRIADWFALKGIIASTETAEWHNPKALQASMGSFLRVPIWYASLEAILSKTSIPILGAVLNGKPMQNQPKLQDAVLVIGSEGKGLSTEISKFITDPITIPKWGGAESLNAGVAAGILIAHLRQPK